MKVTYLSLNKLLARDLGLSIAIKPTPQSWEERRLLLRHMGFLGKVEGLRAPGNFDSMKKEEVGRQPNVSYTFYILRTNYYHFSSFRNKFMIFKIVAIKCSHL